MSGLALFLSALRLLAGCRKGYPPVIRRASAVPYGYFSQRRLTTIRTTRQSLFTWKTRTSAIRKGSRVRWCSEIFSSENWKCREWQWL